MILTTISTHFIQWAVQEGSSTPSTNKNYFQTGFYTCKKIRVIPFKWHEIVMKFWWYKGWENIVFHLLFSAIASEKVTEDIWDLVIETVKVRWNSLISAPLLTWFCTECASAYFFGEAWAFFRRRGNTYVSLPRHSHGVLHTYTFIHKHTRIVLDYCLLCDLLCHCHWESFTIT